MKTLKDRDLGIDCDFVASAETTPEVIEIMTAHVQEQHPEEYDRVKGMMKMNIQETEGEEAEEEEEDDEEVPEVGDGNTDEPEPVL